MIRLPARRDRFLMVTVNLAGMFVSCFLGTADNSGLDNAREVIAFLTSGMGCC